MQNIGNNDYSCPRCKSTTTQTCLAVYRQATHRSETTGGGIILAPFIPVVFGTTTESQTVVATRCGPPLKPLRKFLAYGFLWFFVIFPFLMLFWNTPVAIPSIFIWIILLFVIMIAEGNQKEQIYKQEKIEYQRKLKQWYKTWYCHTCGTLFEL